MNTLLINKIIQNFFCLLIIINLFGCYLYLDKKSLGLAGDPNTPKEILNELSSPPSLQSTSRPTAKHERIIKAYIPNHPIKLGSQYGAYEVDKYHSAYTHIIYKNNNIPLPEFSEYKTVLKTHFFEKPGIQDIYSVLIDGEIMYVGVGTGARFYFFNPKNKEITQHCRLPIKEGGTSNQYIISSAIIPDKCKSKQECLEKSIFSTRSDLYFSKTENTYTKFNLGSRYKDPCITSICKNPENEEIYILGLHGERKNRSPLFVIYKNNEFIQKSISNLHPKDYFFHHGYFRPNNPNILIIVAPTKTYEVNINSLNSVE